MVLHHTRPNLCQKFCTANMAHFWPKGMWLSSSPDLNPLDFAVWDELERKTNKTPHPNVNALKGTIRTEWDNMAVEFLINSCRLSSTLWKLSVKLKEATLSESAHKGPAYKFC
ncbi:Uncharacterized protein FKW44_007679 [Caligus rogercresseyi]|uniref:Transposable element Tc1 transposase n=1 Tax=Caligus rogercresseyi TaxID=217165 RepID=A0A7T8KF42_CALRO|nr:Uncharacterized protein FKW44_007679 [Caligus rogercresseyi]